MRDKELILETNLDLVAKISAVDQIRCIRKLNENHRTRPVTETICLYIEKLSARSQIYLTLIRVGTDYAESQNLADILQ